ncbi:MAG: hypothetical protein HN334_04995 [Candidatus Cloacimonetes bacterium]|nr:hypothetical protein [Candidatus Cloacimonadota bacterium]
MNSEILSNFLKNLLKIKEGEVVSIFAEIDNHQYTLPFIEDLAVAIRRQNAIPNLDFYTQNIKRIFSEKWANRTELFASDYYQNKIKNIDYFLIVGWHNFSDKLNDFTKDFLSNLYKNGKNIIFLNFPTEKLSFQTGLSIDKLIENYWRSIDCDFSKLSNVSKKQADFLSKSQYFLLSSETEKLKIKIESNLLKIVCGNIDKEQIIVLPTGFIEMKLEREFLDGFFWAEKAYYQNNVFENVKIKFENGNIKYAIFNEEKEGNILLQNALVNIVPDCKINFGFNEKIIHFSNHIYYDRCLENNISLIFYDQNSAPIYFSNTKLKIKKIKE